MFPLPGSRTLTLDPPLLADRNAGILLILSPAHKVCMANRLQRPARLCRSNFAIGGLSVTLSCDQPRVQLRSTDFLRADWRPVSRVQIVLD
jgi:hypothetical protein